MIGGRGAAPDSQTSAILAIDPASGRVRHAGALVRPLSDAAVATVGGHIVLAGGQSAAGTQSSIFELMPRRVARGSASGSLQRVREAHRQRVRRREIDAIGVGQVTRPRTGWWVWPYCQTILLVWGSTTITRSFLSSLASTSPLGNGSASEG